MISYAFSSILWLTLIGLNLAISARLARMYRQDFDIRKLMFIIGLLMCINVYAIAIVGIESFLLARNILEWSPLPLLLAFILSSLHERCKTDSAKCYKFFLTGTAFSIVMFFIPPAADFSQPVLLSGLSIAILLSIVQHSKKFDLPSATLSLSMPSFAVSYISIGQGMTELALFAAFAAIGTLLLAFEISKSQGVETTSVLVLKKELYAAEHKFSRLFNMLPDPAAIFDARGVILAASPSLLALSGLKREDLVGKNFLKTDFISDSSKFKMVQHLGSRMLDLEIPPYEIEVQVKDGKKGQFEVNTSKIAYGGTTAAMVVLRDLTERNRLLEKIEREQMRFQDIAERTGDWIWELDSEGKFVYSNHVVSKIIGYTPEEIISKKASEILIPSSGEHEGFFLESSIKAGNLSPIIMQCSRRDGGALILEIQAMPLAGLNGELAGYRGVCRDFTEKQEMEKRLLKAERYAAIGELSTMVAHDLRNPLQGISNAIHFLKKLSKNAGNERTSFLVLSIEEALNHAEKIVSELLDYSADIRLELIESNPKSIVMQALSRIVVPDNIRIVEKTNTDPKIRVDTDKITRVIVNLVTNAFDAMPKCGTLTIESKELECCMHLSITDNGTGISDEKINRLWTPFITTKAQGIGLGLPISKRIVEAHNGEIKVESEKGKGTTFTIVLPTAATSEKSVEFCLNEPEVADHESNKTQTRFSCSTS